MPDFYTPQLDPQHPARHLCRLETPFGARTVYDSVSYCNRCGSCQQACPTYLLTLQETFSPRGRNQLVRLAAEGKLNLTRNRRQAEETLNSCLLCGRGEIHIRSVVCNINILAICFGAALFLLHISLPPLIDQTLSSVGSMIGPVGMLITGMAIADCDLKEIFGKLHAYLPVGLRLVVYPVVLAGVLALLGAASFIDDGKNILMTIFLASITPTAAIVTSMAALYDKDPVYSAELCVLSTILSILTMPALLFVFDKLI